MMLSGDGLRIDEDGAYIIFERGEEGHFLRKAMGANESDPYKNSILSGVEREND